MKILLFFEVRWPRPTGWGKRTSKIRDDGMAGSVVVHSMGGWLALPAIIILGPRVGRWVNGKSTCHSRDSVKAKLLF